MNKEIIPQRVKWVPVRKPVANAWMNEQQVFVTAYGRKKIYDQIINIEFRKQLKATDPPKRNALLSENFSNYTIIIYIM